MSAIRIVLFDIGGVLASDYWETVLLAPEGGLADRLGQPRAKVTAAAEGLWGEFSTRRATESEYWARLAEAIGQPIRKELVNAVERELVKGNPLARSRICDLRRQGIDVGVVTNNTSFWWPRQLEIAAVADLIEPALIFASCDYGVTKSQQPVGLFDVLAKRIDPSSTLVVDDRPHNVDAALIRGFDAVRYSFSRDNWPSQLSAIAV